MSIKTRRLWCGPQFACDNMPQDLNELKQHIKHLTATTANEDVAKRDFPNLSKQTELSGEMKNNMDFETWFK